MRRLGLRGRVTLASVAVLALALGGLSLAGNLLLASRLSADADAVLHDRAAARLATINVENGRLRAGERLRGGAIGQETWVYDAAGRAVLRGDAGPQVQAAADELSRTAGRASRTVGEEVRLLAVPARARGSGRRLGTVVVGLSLSPYERTEHLAVIGTIVLDVFVLLATALLLLRAVGEALRPVADMTARAAEWSANDLHRRFSLGPPHDELTGLAATLDGLLARLDSALRHEQRFSAEMAHELRTPLANLRMEAELALRDDQGDADRREALERVVAGTDRMAGVIETLLSTARTGESTTPAACDAAAAVREVADSMRPAAEAHDVWVDVHADAGAAPVRVGHDVVAQALHPLMENAVRHARTRVGVDLVPAGDEVVVAVTDDGPGFDGLDPEAAFQPGASTTGGAGLGLPLARRLARSGGGDVVVTPRAEGAGARLELRLPAGTR